MITRRKFLQLTSAAGAGLLLSTYWRLPKAFPQVAGGTLAPGDVGKFMLPLVKPPAMPGKFQKKKDQYKIAVRQFSQRILSPPHPETTVWGYGSVNHPGTVAEGGAFNYPAFTIEARWNKEVQVIWRNQLVLK